MEAHNTHLPTNEAEKKREILELADIIYAQEEDLEAKTVNIGRFRNESPLGLPYTVVAAANRLRDLIISFWSSC